LIKSSIDKVTASNPNNNTTINTQPDADSVRGQSVIGGGIALGGIAQPASEQSLSKTTGEIEDIIKQMEEQ
jgi:hypothetical protein